MYLGNTLQFSARFVGMSLGISIRDKCLENVSALYPFTIAHDIYIGYFSKSTALLSSCSIACSRSVDLMKSSISVNVYPKRDWKFHMIV